MFPSMLRAAPADAKALWRFFKYNWLNSFSIRWLLAESARQRFPTSASAIVAQLLAAIDTHWSCP